MNQRIFESHEDLSQAAIEERAARLGIDMTAFRKCL